MSKQYVLDSWALLALLQGEEPAAARVKEILIEGERQQAALLISIMNLGEVYYRVGRRSRSRGSRGYTEPDSAAFP